MKINKLFCCPLYVLLAVLSFFLFSTSAFAVNCIVPGQLSSDTINSQFNLSSSLNTTTYIPVGTIVIPKGTAVCNGGSGHDLSVAIYDSDGTLMSNTSGSADIAILSLDMNVDLRIVVGVNGACIDSSSYTQVNVDGKNSVNFTVCIKFTTKSTPPVAMGSYNAPVGYIVIFDSASVPTHLSDLTNSIQLFLGGDYNFPYTCINLGSSVVDLPPTMAFDYIGHINSIVGQKESYSLLMNCGFFPNANEQIDVAFKGQIINGTDLVTDNPDISVRIFDGDGKIVIPDGSTNSYIVRIGQGGVVSAIPFSFAAVSSTGKKPAAGSFLSIVTMDIYHP